MELDRRHKIRVLECMQAFLPAGTGETWGESGKLINKVKLQPRQDSTSIELSNQVFRLKQHDRRVLVLFESGALEKAAISPSILTNHD